MMMIEYFYSFKNQIQISVDIVVYDEIADFHIGLIEEFLMKQLEFITAYENQLVNGLRRNVHESFDYDNS